MSYPLYMYAADELGAYGYVEKPWYLPGVRLHALLDTLSAQGLLEQIALDTAPPATDQDLQSFHTPAYIKKIKRACDEGVGSLDQAAPVVIEDIICLLQAVQTLSISEGFARIDTLTAEVGARLLPAMSVEIYREYLMTEGLWDDPYGPDTLSLTSKGIIMLNHETPSLPGPTHAREGVERAARWVCGAAISATERILDGSQRRVFIPISGFHHAHAGEARLYCIYNDPVLAIQRALSGVSGTVAYIDIDIHQGDGVYEAFADEPRVVIVDLHEDPSTLFPFSPDQPGIGSFPGRREEIGRGVGVGTKLNLPLAPQTTDHQYLMLWDEAEQFLRDAKPEFIIFESGVDGLGDDPMSNQRLTTEAIEEVTRRVCRLAEEFAAGRLLVLGGGGYSVASSSRGWSAVVRALLEEPSARKALDSESQS